MYISASCTSSVPTLREPIAHGVQKLHIFSKLRRVQIVFISVRSPIDIHMELEMSSHQSCKSYSFSVSEIPSHDFCFAYLERHHMILRIIRDAFL